LSGDRGLAGHLRTLEYLLQRHMPTADKGGISLTKKLFDLKGISPLFKGAALIIQYCDDSLLLHIVENFSHFKGQLSFSERPPSPQGITEISAGLEGKRKNVLLTIYCNTVQWYLDTSGVAHGDKHVRAQLRAMLEQGLKMLPADAIILGSHPSAQSKCL
jgi:hypothetical protein